jgi:Ca-activated chloride channel family protein
MNANTRPQSLPPGWRGIARLVLDSLIAGLIAGVVLMLAVVAAVSRAEAATPVATLAVAPVSAAATASIATPAAPRVSAPAAGSMVALAAIPAAAVGTPATSPPSVQHAALVLGDDGDAPFDAPLVATEVDIEVAGIVARATVTQHFINPTAQWREGVYVFPLPENAAVDQLHMKVGDRVIEGRIQEKAAARATYDKAKAEGVKASLIEQQRPNLFTARVAHLGPNEEVTVTIEYQQTLRYDNGSFHLRFPLAITPRYTPPAAGAIVEAAEAVARDDPLLEPPVLAPGSPPTNPVSLHVGVDAGFPLSLITSASHRIDVKEQVAHRYDVTLADDIVAADRDFELAWTPEVGNVPGAALFTESRDGKTWALLMILPPSTPSQAPIAPREAIFIVDTSGSMSGVSIAQAREAVTFALSRLKPGDRFNVIEFNSVTRPLFTAPMPVDPSTLARARTFVAGLRADGGTEMKPALTAALSAPIVDGFVQQVVFITDGAVGNEQELLDLIDARAGSRRLFTVGIGPGPNTWFLRKAAQMGRGTATFISDVRDVKSRMTELYAKLENPALTDIGVTWSAPADAYPRAVPDLYLGEPIVLTAQFTTPLVSLSLTGRRGSEAWGEMLPLAAGQPSTGIATLWARDRIEALSDAMVNGDAASIKPMIIETALAHHLISRYTSLVAVDVTPTLPAGAASELTAMPVNLPAGYGADSMLGALPQTATPAPLLFALGVLLLLVAVAAYALSRRRRGGATLPDRVHAARLVC